MLFTAHVKGHGAVEIICTDIFQVCVVEVHRFVSYEKLVFPTYRPLSALMPFCATGVQPGCHPLKIHLIPELACDTCTRPWRAIRVSLDVSSLVRLLLF